MYDKDESGTIELVEMTDIIGTLYDMEGVSSSGGEGNISKSNWKINILNEPTWSEYYLGINWIWKNNINLIKF